MNFDKFVNNRVLEKFPSNTGIYQGHIQYQGVS